MSSPLVIFCPGGQKRNQDAATSTAVSPSKQDVLLFLIHAPRLPCTLVDPRLEDLHSVYDQRELRIEHLCRTSAQLHALDEDLEVLHDLRLARIDVDLER